MTFRTDPPERPVAGSSQSRRLGHLLVAAQFTLMAVLVVLGAQALQPWPAAPRLAASALLAAAGAVLGLAALAANRPGNFNIHPAPRDGGSLVVHGPYRWIRHPMYAAVLLLGAAFATLSAGPAAALSWAALLLVLLAKASLEERWMAAHHAGYRAYCRRTGRLLPPLRRPAGDRA